jgi:hypothetical protein
VSRRGGFLLLVAVAALAAACTADVDGSPSPAPVTTPAAHTLDPDHITAKDALGDFTTVDPCTMFSISDLPLEYTAQFDARFDVPSAVDTCLVSMRPKGADFVDIEWGFLQDADSMTRQGSWHRQSLGHGLGLWTSDAPGRCVQELVFADDITMTVGTTAFGGKPAGLCTMGRTVIDLIVKSLPVKPPIQRTMPANSLAHQDACKLLPEDLARTMPGGTGARTDRVSPTGHLCHYNNAHMDLELVFTVEPADEQPLDDEKPVTIAGRQSLRSQGYNAEAKESRCLLSTKHVPITSKYYSQPANEGLLLMVYLDGKSSSICADATKIAERIWKKLPA